ncbi:MAG: hypothetical protein AMXMBFR33_73220 [Candidatus Xenobia bacterium]
MTSVTLGTRVGSQEPALLRPDDLVTHGLILGMTGSGKTGLGIGLLEELALAGVPLIVVDLKGDLTNLAMVFPEHRPEDYLPWLDEAALGRQGQTPQQAAQALARQRAVECDQVRTRQWREKVQVRIYTPGSDLGRPVSVLGSLAPPGPEVMQDAAARADLITGTVLGLLSLVGKQADPLQDPEAILLSQIVDSAWSQNEALTLEALITRVVDPPFPRVGVFPVDTFLPPDKRLVLARQLNGILASPTFAPWTRGADLDLNELLKTPVSLFYLAHLTEPERMFFLTLLLQRVVAWTRSLGGSSSLRALLYIDEVAGYLPPHPFNPPTKKPVMTLLKQARGVGVGTLLATQNPVDVDYKAMSNTGSWWIGKLQTSQDRDRVAEGLGCAREQFDQLEKRVFLYKPAGSEQLELVRTRTTLAWLRGPLTLPELRKLDAAPAVSPAPLAPKPPPADELSAPPPLKGLESLVLDPRVVFSARLEGRFEPFAEPHREDGKLKLCPALYARLAVRFDEEKTGYLHDHVESRVYFPLSRGLKGEFLPLALQDEDLLPRLEEPGVYTPLPPELDEVKEWQAASKTIQDDIYRNLTRSQWVNPRLKLYGQAEESREAFQERCQRAVEEKIAARSDLLRQRYQKQADQLSERIRAQSSKLTQRQSEAASRRTEGILNVGEAVLGFFTGRRRSVRGLVSGNRTTQNAELRAKAAADDLDALQEKAEQLALELQDQLDRIRTEEERALDATEARPVRLDKQDVQMARLCLLWIPVSRRV